MARSSRSPAHTVGRAPSVAIARKWLMQAMHDLEMAERNVGIEGYDVAAFLAHQPVELLLKSIFAIEGRRIMRTHDLDELARALAIDDEVMALVLELTADYTLARYPDVAEAVPYLEYDEQTASEKVAAGRRIFQLLEARYKVLMEEGTRGE